jgi:hypothetical protein
MNAKFGSLTLLVCSCALPLNAAILTVTTLNDAGAGSLRNAVVSSGSGDTVQFAVTGKILLSSEIVIDHSLWVQGPGASSMTVDAGHVDRAFRTTNAIDVIMSGLTISNGYIFAPKGADGGIGQNGGSSYNVYGGGILDQGNSFVLSNCWLTGNVVQGGVGGKGGSNVIGITYFKPGTGGSGTDGVGGALFSVSYDLRLLNCTFSYNQAIGGAGGIGGVNVASSLDFGGTGGVGGVGQAGAVGSSGAAVTGFTNCTFSGNVAIGGPGGQGGNNTDGGVGGTGGQGGSGYGGAIALFYVGNFLSSTIVSNQALAGAGGLGGSGVPNGAAGTLGFAMGGGVTAYSITCNNKIGNTILSDNYATSANTNYYAGFNDLGFNFIGTWDVLGCSWPNSTQVGSIASPIHAYLAPLAQNGSGLPTHATVAMVPATVTDAGNSFGTYSDERGAPRPYDIPIVPNAIGGDGSDIGAFELGSADLGLGMGGSSSNLVISWPAYYGDAVLQVSTNLHGSNIWGTAPDAPTLVGNLFVVTNRMTNRVMFYRLGSH